MTSVIIRGRNLQTLKHPALDLPKQRPPGDFGDFLEQTFTAFFERLSHFEEPLAELVRARGDRARTLAASLVSAWRLGAAGDAEGGYQCFVPAMDSVRDDLVAMSRRHSEKILPGQSLYRMASWKGVALRKHMFHAPFEMPSKSYRFSTPDRPTLYLGNSVYLCWLECGQPAIADCFVSRFELDASGFEFLDIAASHSLYLEPLDVAAALPMARIDPTRVSNSPFKEDVQSELANYLALWPLFAAVSVQKAEPAPENPPEYLLPQMLMRWTEERDGFIGVRYFTSKPDKSSNSQDWPINLAIPTRTKKASGYCDVLRSRALCTLPQHLGAMDQRSLAELVTKAAVDARAGKLGRDKIHWPKGTMQEYFATPFGKMEYWLDRPEIGVAEIETN